MIYPYKTADRRSVGRRRKILFSPRIKNHLNR